MWSPTASNSKKRDNITEMEVSSLCLMLSATLVVTPDRSQFFQYESINLNCEANSTGWSVKRNTSRKISEVCTHGWGEPAVGVILEIPTLPVTTGDEVALRCIFKEKGVKPTSNFSAAFYKNTVFIGDHPAGKLIFQAVSKSDEGFYGCGHPKNAKSQQSWLAVTDQPRVVCTPPPPLMSLSRLLCSILIFHTFTVIFIVCIYIYQRWARARANA
ncbi:uncharacterized protein isoform X3 [Notothenia coriiceps]|uniref:Uncharacterized protein isoform X3 n=1 Tax=Notothenia coriiceps TaxID=8208 RepID=A0A6I9MIS8_9TELE|nr:PREDICTED: uncharacterized protein LOC104941039 isoform X3 [Notothenia coriiceps]